ncbi:hypothetical protein OS493_038036 [Desmophyllum pertusum]|uniref:Uncharacterized protein n=1 Tax=Desmophyllum pertusum TaxID=174260 RepID=A0A9W9YXG9_9CNID|nr:hypothetical protein OS493_038036 [Desmophyllum pertusum]
MKVPGCGALLTDAIVEEKINATCPVSDSFDKSHALLNSSHAWCTSTHNTPLYLSVTLVDGGYTPWSDWTTCSISCGNGTSVRYRSCADPAPANGGENCTGESIQMKKCVGTSCPVAATSSLANVSPSPHVSPSLAYPAGRTSSVPSLIPSVDASESPAATSVQFTSTPSLSTSSFILPPPRQFPQLSV